MPTKLHPQCPPALYATGLSAQCVLELAFGLTFKINLMLSLLSVLLHGEHQLPAGVSIKSIKVVFMGRKQPGSVS